MKQYLLKSTGLCFVFSLLIALVSCENELEIKKNFNYEITMQKFRTDVTVGVPVNLVFYIQSEGQYEYVRYSVNYFLRSGRGQLKANDNTSLLNNINYRIDGNTLKISYTPLQAGEHIIETEFIDSFNLKREVTIKLNAD